MLEAATAAAIGGGLSYLGASKSGDDMRDAAVANAWFQDKMSRNQHQRAVKDLRKAGLNPILAARYGGNAMPSSAAAMVPNYGAVADAAVSAFGAATQGQQVEANIHKIGQDIAESASRIGLNNTNAAKALEEIKLVSADVAKRQAETGNVTKDGQIKDFEIWKNGVMQKFGEKYPENVAMQMFGIDGKTLHGWMSQVMAGLKADAEMNFNQLNKAIDEAINALHKRYGSKKNIIPIRPGGQK